MAEPFHKRQPILAGCLGCLTLGTLGTIAAIVFTGVLGKSCLDTANRELGLDSLPSTVQDAVSQGFGISVGTGSGQGPSMTMVPMEPRLVTCDQLQAVLFPHLTGTLETVVVRSESYETGPDGRLQPVPLTCTWTGFPSKDTPLGSGTAAPAGDTK